MPDTTRTHIGFANQLRHSSLAGPTWKVLQRVDSLAASCAHPPEGLGRGSGYAGVTCCCLCAVPANQSNACDNWRDL